MSLLQFHLKPSHHPLSFNSNPQRKSPNPITINLPSKTLLKPSNATNSKLPSLLTSFSTSQNPNHNQPNQQIPNTFHSLSSIKPYILSQYNPILLGWLCSLVSALCLSQIVPRIGKFSANVGKTDASGLTNEGVVLAALFLAKLIATYGQHSLLWEAALNAGYEIRVHVFERVLKRELGFFEGGTGISSGDIAYRITAEAADVSDTVYALLNTIVPSALQLSAMASRMLAISPVLSLISAMVIPCMALAIACLGEKLRKISKKSHLSIASLSAYLNEVLPAILFVKANNAELSETARFQKLAHADLTEHFKKKNMKVLIPQITQIVYFGALFMLCCGSLVISCGCFDGCSMISFVTSLVFLVEPIQDVGKAYNEWKQGEPAIERLFDLTRLTSKVIEKLEAVHLDHVTGDVKFCDISFRYGESRPSVLNKVNLHIKAGETVALVGPSGGGKTTLIKLLLRLYDPSSGCILLDNQNIENMRLDSLRRHVGLVSQDTTLFSGTIAENIGYRDLMTGIDMEKVEMAAKTANADEFIRMLPKGYKTNIGPRGSSLSGGQKQRSIFSSKLSILSAVYM
ncbi:ABC transporter B family member 29, chloroplastic isoform X2 [Mercurialis annua]|uniref:ABC transporter B family member 29, chloroplastic isoform X2 n=1 Tax=Mercurialis annua TaxID=3986 RepID=UPI00216103E0|nr:ABC transporter B family member 29, chloroplastic isoform X2 [Mercurialis annua]